MFIYKPSRVGFTNAQKDLQIFLKIIPPYFGGIRSIQHPPCFVIGGGWGSISFYIHPVNTIYLLLQTTKCRGV